MREQSSTPPPTALQLLRGAELVPHMGKPKSNKAAGPKSPIIDNTYRRIHKQYNPHKGTFEVFEAVAKQERNDKSVLFNVVYHKASPQMRAQSRMLVELKCQFLVGHIQRYMGYVLEVRGSYNHDYENYDEGTLNEFQVDSKKLFGNIDLLRNELVRQQATPSGETEIWKKEQPQDSETMGSGHSLPPSLRVKSNNSGSLVEVLTGNLRPPDNDSRN